MRRSAISACVLAYIMAIAAQGAEHVCAACHPQQTSRYLASPMGKSIGPPESLSAGEISHAASGSILSAFFKPANNSGKLFHRLTERGLTAEYPVAYQIGRGIKARTYAVRVNDYLLESPLSWYKSAGWDVSPGYESMQVLDFDRPITENCLFCHADRAKATDSDGRRLPEKTIAAIGCDRCHGGAQQHLQHPTAKNIVNPAKLTGATRDSVCEQCHLEGETRVVQPGKTQWAYQPGDAIENTAVTYLLKSKADEHRAVNQVEELAESQCVRASGGKLWCGSCHDPHGETGKRSTQVNAVCSTCHLTLSKAGHSAKDQDCVSCHMTRRPASNVAHLAITDHRLILPGKGDRTADLGPETLIAWREGPAEYRKRDAALAGLQLAAEKRLPALASQSMKLLESLPEMQQNNDPDVLSSLEVLFLGTSTPQKAVALSRWAVESSPGSATFALNYGMALQRAGDLTAAEAQMLRAIMLDPSLMQAAAQLAVLYDQQGRKEKSRQVVDQFLKWNPQNIQFRLTLR